MSANPLSNDDRLEVVRETEESRVQKHLKQVYRLIDDNLASVGGIETAAGFCGVDRGDLRKAIDRGTKNQIRYLAVDHVVAIMTRMRQHNAGKATELAASLVFPAGFLVFPLVEMPVEEENRRLKQLVRSMPLGEQLIEQALKTP